MLQIYQALIMGMIQGLAEWLPISSSGHLALLHNLFGFQSLPFDVFLHLASILAVIIVFWKDIIDMFRLTSLKKSRYLVKIIFAIIPAGLVGYFFKDAVEASFSNLFYVGVFFLISGMIVSSASFFKSTVSRKGKKKVTFLDSIVIGLFQMISVLPGISRSGATISAGLFRGVKKEEAVKFSFLLAVPVVLGAAILELKDGFSIAGLSWPILAASFVVTFIASLLSIKFLLNVVKQKKFHYFGLYSLAMGLVILIAHFVMK